MRKFIRRGYDKFISGRDMSAVVNYLGALPFWKQPQKSGDLPMPKERWESQYRSGHWKYLIQLDELAHYSVVIGYFSYFKKGGFILDVGCGEGILKRRLDPCLYSKYVGVDISSEAVSQASFMQDEKSSFICADAESYVPEESFDAIVFNESLCYFHDPINTMKRYERNLREDGIFITSLYVTERSTGILQQLRAACSSHDEVEITNKSKTWICSVWRPFNGS